MTALIGAASSLVASRLSASIGCSGRSSCTPRTVQRRSLVVCQSGKDKVSVDATPSESSRRSVLLATASAAAASLLVQPEAQAKRKPPPPPQEKRPEDDKNLSALDAKKLANARRKEAMRAMVEGAKAKANGVQEVLKAPSNMSIGSSS